MRKRGFMILFASDLDNTLVYSYKREIGKRKVCVELYEGREVSFMTEKSYQLLNEIKKELCFVPITTRSAKQYQRISFEKGWFPNYALVCNGGVLLVEDKIDKDWYEDSLQMIQCCKEELEKGKELLQKDKFRKFEIKKINDLFLFTKSSQPNDTMLSLKEGLKEEQVDVLNNGEKIYIIPKSLNKGTALERIRKKIKANFTIAAGDSEFDISMLNKADISFVPEKWKEKVQGKQIKAVQKNIIFSDYILEYIKNKELGKKMVLKD